MNDSRVATYGRLSDAQIQIARAVEKHGVKVEAIEHALDLAESPAPEQESDRELYLGTLKRYVEALGGELLEEPRLAATFPEGTIELAAAPAD